MIALGSQHAIKNTSVILYLVRCKLRQNFLPSRSFLKAHLGINGEGIPLPDHAFTHPPPELRRFKEIISIPQMLVFF